MVTEGMVKRGAKVRLLRDNVVIHEGALTTLKRFKDEVREVQRRLRVRHGVRELPRHPGRRRDRVLRRRGSPADPVAGARLVARRLAARRRGTGVTRSRWRRRRPHRSRHGQSRARPAPAPRRRGAAPSAGRAARARRHARSRPARRLDHRDRGRCQPRPAQRHRLRDAARRPGRAAPARRPAPRGAVVPRPGRRAAPACATRRRSASSSTAPSTRPTASARCCAGPTWRATSRTTDAGRRRAAMAEATGRRSTAGSCSTSRSGMSSTPAVGTGAPAVRRRRRPAMAARSIRWRPACCRSRSARRPRPCPSSWTAARNTASRSASGEARTTDDAEGEVTATSDAAARPTTAIRGRPAGASSARSSRSRRPSRRSRSTGERAYDLARAGEPVDLQAAPGRRSSGCELLGRPDADHADFVVGCGKGTYIRSLGRDLALALGHRRPPVGAASDAPSGRSGEEAAISLAKLEALGHIPAASRGPGSRRDRAGRHPGAGPDGDPSGPAAPRPAGALDPGRTARPARWFAPSRTAGWWRWSASRTALLSSRCASSTFKSMEIPMSITAERKAELIKSYAQGKGDTGSPEVQVAILSERITQPHRALQGPREGSPFAPRPADDGRPAPPSARLSQAPRTASATRR